MRHWPELGLLLIGLVVFSKALQPPRLLRSNNGSSRTRTLAGKVLHHRQQDPPKIGTFTSFKNKAVSAVDYSSSDKESFNRSKRSRRKGTPPLVTDDTKQSFSSEELYSMDAQLLELFSQPFLKYNHEERGKRKIDSYSSESFHEQIFGKNDRIRSFVSKNGPIEFFKIVNGFANLNRDDRDSTEQVKMRVENAETMMQFFKAMPPEFKKRFIIHLLHSDRRGLSNLMRQMIEFHMNTALLDSSSMGNSENKSISSFGNERKGKENFISISQFQSRQGISAGSSSSDRKSQARPRIESAIMLHRETISEPARIVTSENMQKKLQTNLNRFLSSNNNRKITSVQHDLSKNHKKLSNQQYADLIEQIRQTPGFDRIMRNILAVLKAEQKLSQLQASNGTVTGKSVNFSPSTLKSPGKLGKELLSRQPAASVDFGITDTQSIGNQLSKLEKANSPDGFPFSDDIFFIDDSSTIGQRLNTELEQTHIPNFFHSPRIPDHSSEVHVKDFFLPSQVLSNVKSQAIVPLSTDIEGQFVDVELENFKQTTSGSSTATLTLPQINEHGNNEVQGQFVPLSTDIEGQLTGIPLPDSNAHENVTAPSQSARILLPTTLFQSSNQAEGATSQDEFGLAISDFSQQSVGVPLPSAQNLPEDNFPHTTFSIPLVSDVPAQSESNINLQKNNFSTTFSNSHEIAAINNDYFQTFGVPLPAINQGQSGASPVGINDIPQQIRNLNELIDTSNSNSESGLNLKLLPRNISIMNNRLPTQQTFGIPLHTFMTLIQSDDARQSFTIPFPNTQTGNSPQPFGVPLPTVQSGDPHQSFGVPLPIVQSANSHQSFAVPLSTAQPVDPRQSFGVPLPNVLSADSPQHFGVPLPVTQSSNLPFISASNFNNENTRFVNTNIALEDFGVPLPGVPPAEFENIHIPSSLRDIENMRKVASGKNHVATAPEIIISDGSIEKFRAEDAVHKISLLRENTKIPSYDAIDEIGYPILNKQGDGHQHVTFLTPGLLVPFADREIIYKSDGKSHVLPKIPLHNYTARPPVAPQYDTRQSCQLKTVVMTTVKVVDKPTSYTTMVETLTAVQYVNSYIVTPVTAVQTMLSSTSEYYDDFEEYLTPRLEPARGKKYHGILTAGSNNLYSEQAFRNDDAQVIELQYTKIARRRRFAEDEEPYVKWLNPVKILKESVTDAGYAATIPFVLDQTVHIGQPVVGGNSYDFGPEQHEVGRKSQYVANINAVHTTFLTTITTKVPKTYLSTRHRVSTIKHGQTITTVMSTAVFCIKKKQDEYSNDGSYESSGKVISHYETPPLPTYSLPSQRKYDSLPLVTASSSSQESFSPYRTWIGTLMDKRSGHVDSQEDIHLPSKFIVLQQLLPKGFIYDDEATGRSHHIKLSTSPDIHEQVKGNVSPSFEDLFNVEHPRILYS